MNEKDSRRKVRPGKVFIVGAGPGNPEYLTVKALKLLSTCDVLLYDRLVDQEIVNLSPPSCERICVGTEHGREPSSKQEFINSLMLDRYLKGMTVVRLKSGDPFIFGRGGEEIEFLRRNSVQYEVVPGLTSAIAVATAAGIPLTHRDHSSSVMIISGHRKSSGSENNWEGISKFDGTLVILMGVGTSSEIASSLINNGMDPSTGVTIIENGTKPEQRVFSCLLRELPEVVREFNIKPPSVIVVGKVINSMMDLGIVTPVSLAGLNDLSQHSVPVERCISETASKESNMVFIPIMLNVTGKKLLMIGGGKAAALKLKSLATKFDDVTVVSDRFDRSIEEFNVKKVTLHINSPNSLSKMIDRNTIVVIASDDEKVNDKIREYCAKEGVLYNSVDRIDSPFIFPAVLNAGGVTVSVSTEGRSPSLSRFLRDELAPLANRYSKALPILEELRNLIPRNCCGGQARYFQNLLHDPEFMKLVDEGDILGAREYAMGLLKS